MTTRPPDHPITQPPDHPIGIFDSGVGGLSVWREIVRQLPHEEVLYFADQAHVPYGPRPLSQVREFATAITRFLLDRGAKVIVVACNTASAAALHHLRATFPQVPFVGMEPAIKPAAQQTRSGKVAVLATPATFQGALFASLLDRFARHVTVLPQVCPGLVEQVEAGLLDGAETEELLRRYLEPLVAAGADQLVLGCTHYPFLRPAIERIVGPAVQVIDPAPAVARQTGRVLASRGRLNEGDRPGQHHFYTSGDPDQFARQVRRLVGDEGPIHPVRWEGGVVVAR